MSTDRSPRIRQLNDGFRKSFIGGQVLITEGVRALGPDFESACVEKVQKHRRFAERNDPYGEHDFGYFDVQGRKCFWKIDYDDTWMKWGSEDPTDTSRSSSVQSSALSCTGSAIAFRCLLHPLRSLHHLRSRKGKQKHQT